MNKGFILKKRKLFDRLISLVSAFAMIGFLWANTAVPVRADAAVTALWPLPKNYTKISSDFYDSRSKTGQHNAIDIPAPEGTSIYAVLDGKVIFSGVLADSSNSCGNTVILYHSSIEKYTVYCHASKLCVTKDQTVKQGDIIAKVGNTGDSQGNHLDFKLCTNYLKSGTPWPRGHMDPMKYFTWTYDIKPHLDFSSDCTKPSGKLTQGKPFTIKGTISSNPELNRVWGGVYNRDGSKTAQFCDVNPKSSTYDLAKYFDLHIIFDDLPVGYYTYKIEATTTDGQHKQIESQFQIGDPEPQKYTVTLNANGGSVSSKSVTVTEKGTYPELPAPTREGYEFAGWYTAASGGKKVAKGDAIASNSNHTLYAYWNGKEHTITFDANGGTVSQTSKKTALGAAYGELPTAERDGYTFNGWFTAAVGGKRISSDAKYSINGDQTLYAHWFKGSGTKESPFLISTKDDLAEMRDLVNNTAANKIYGNAYYKQTVDIDLSGDDWTPIGLGYDGDDGQGDYNCTTKMFFGTYDGAEHYIKGLSVSGKWQVSGLFAFVREKGCVSSLVVYGTNKNASGSAGGIAGAVHYGAVIKNCGFVGDVSCEGERAGGIAGHLYGGGIISDCYHIGNVSGGNIAGGITAHISFAEYGKDGDSAEVKNCYHAGGTVKGKASGAIAAECSYYEGISNTAAISNCYASSDCGANAGAKGATTDTSLLLRASEMKKLSEDLGSSFTDQADSTLISGYPVFAWEAKEKTAVTTTVTDVPASDNKCGDANCDSSVDLSDAVIIMQSICNPSKFGVDGTDEHRITAQGQKNADCCNTGDGVTNADALAIQKYKLALITSLPEMK